MLVKTHEIKGRALDYAVAYSNGHGIDGYHPSTDWAQGGPLIEAEGIDLSKAGRLWWAVKTHKHIATDESALVAAMRCYVLHKWNDQIEIPEEFA